MTDNDSLARSMRTFDRAQHLLKQIAERKARAKLPAINRLRRADKVICKELGISRKQLRRMGRTVALTMLEDKLEAAKTGRAPLPKGLASDSA